MVAIVQQQPTQRRYVVLNEQGAVVATILNDRPANAWRFSLPGSEAGLCVLPDGDRFIVTTMNAEGVPCIRFEITADGLATAEAWGEWSETQTGGAPPDG